MKPKTLTYEGAGISYTAMDPWKISCQSAARETHQHLSKHSLREVEWSRGESVYLIEHHNFYLGHVQEGLGTKNLVADEMYKLTGRSFYDAIAQDLVAMIVNDLITLGVSPVSLALHVAAGNSDWFTDKIRAQDFIRGFKNACDLSGAVWGPGESPTLPQIVSSETVELSGSGIGIVSPKDRLIRPAVQDGDSIVLIESSGIHANGLTLARRIAKDLKLGYLTQIDSQGTTYGEALLKPTTIYNNLVQAILDAKVAVHYVINITGHGWRKLMRHPKPFAYAIDFVPEPQAIFRFIQAESKLTDREAYGNLNMGAGFAFITPENSVEKVKTIAASLGLQAWRAGNVATSNESTLNIKPKGLVYKAENLVIR